MGEYLHEATIIESATEVIVRHVPVYEGALPYMANSVSKKDVCKRLYTQVILYCGPFQIEPGGAVCLDEEFGKRYPDIRKENPELVFCEGLEAGVALGERIHVVLSRPGYYIWGHWLIDILPKVEAALASLPRSRICAVLPVDAPKWVRPLIVQKYPTLEIADLRVGEVLMGNLLIVSPTRYHDMLSSRATSFAISTDPGAERSLLYVGRRDGVSGRSLTNRAEVSEEISRRGFRLYFPEDDSIADQIRTFASAIAIIGEAGSGLHNSIFSPPGSEVLVMQSSRQNHFIQAGLCYWKRQAVYYLFGEAKSDDWAAPYSIDVGQLREFLDRRNL